MIKIVEGDATVYTNSEAVSVELLTQENQKTFLRTAGMGLVGNALLAPVGLGVVGLAAGLLKGGRKTECAFIMTAADGRFCLATGSPKEYQREVVAARSRQLLPPRVTTAQTTPVPNTPGLWEQMKKNTERLEKQEKVRRAGLTPKQRDEEDTVRVRSKATKFIVFCLAMSAWWVLFWLCFR
jgi:hypothetical protein